jgi:hypothetical protein
LQLSNEQMHLFLDQLAVIHGAVETDKPQVQLVKQAVRKLELMLLKLPPTTELIAPSNRRTM